MIFVNSVARSTLDCSSAPLVNCPLPPTPGVERTSAPDAVDSAYIPPPSSARPLTLLNCASTICATSVVFPLLNTAETVPSAPMATLLKLPGAAPFCVLEVTALGLPYAVMFEVPPAVRSFQVIPALLSTPPSASFARDTLEGGIVRSATAGSVEGAVPRYAEVNLPV